MWRGAHDDSDIGGSHSRGDRDDQGRFGMKIEMSVVDRFLRVRFRVFSPRRIAWGLWGRSEIWSTYSVRSTYLCFGEGWSPGISA
jgi:hypothetical protein